jgi:hypothetical protein
VAIPATAWPGVRAEGSLEPTRELNLFGLPSDFLNSCTKGTIVTAVRSPPPPFDGVEVDLCRFTHFASILLLGRAVRRLVFSLARRSMAAILRLAIEFGDLSSTSFVEICCTDARSAAGGVIGTEGLRAEGVFVF